jgi:hypothetical protein
MEIPLDLERRLERRWAVRFLRTKRIDLKGRINPMPRPTTAKYPLGRPPARTGEAMVWQHQEAEALSIGPISDFAKNGLAK